MQSWKNIIYNSLVGQLSHCYNGYHIYKSFFAKFDLVSNTD